MLLALALTFGSPAQASAAAPAALAPPVTLAPGAVPGASISTTGLPAGSVRLTWSAAATATPPVTGYVVGRTGSSTVNPTPYSETVPAGQRSWIFSKLVPGQEYRLWVAAVDAGGVGPASTVTYRYLPAGFVPSPPPAPVLPAVRWVDGTSAEISWLAPDSDGGSPVTGYEVARDGAAYGNPGPYSTTVQAATKAFTFRQLIPGRTYTLSVRAVTAAGKGPAATSTYTVPAYGSPQPDAPVYALRLDGERQKLERISGPGPVGSGGPLLETETYRDVSFVLDRQGSLYVADPVAATVRKYPVNGGPPVAVGSGWIAPTDINLDARGNVYVLDTSLDRAVMIRASDGRRIVFPQDATDADLTVGLDGSVALSSTVLENGPARVEIKTVQALGERPATVRRVEGGHFMRAIAGINGTVFLHTNSQGGAWADYLTRVDVGATDGTIVLGPSSIAMGSDRQGRVVASTIRHWCPSPQGCVDDYTVDALTVFGAGSTRTTVPVSGTSRLSALAGDTSGRFYATRHGDAPALLRMPAAGGPATVLVPGTFGRFVVG